MSELCSWCGHPAHQPDACQGRVLVARNIIGRLLRRRFGAETVTEDCACAWPGPCQATWIGGYDVAISCSRLAYHDPPHRSAIGQEWS